jgi:hypothetical protein
MVYSATGTEYSWGFWSEALTRFSAAEAKVEFSVPEGAEGARENKGEGVLGTKVQAVLTVGEREEDCDIVDSCRASEGNTPLTRASCRS